MNRYVLDASEPPRVGRLSLEIDDDNVFEDSPTAIVITIEGRPHDNAQVAVDIGPVYVVLDGVRADAVVAVTITEAEAIHAALGEMIAEVRES